MTDSNWKRGGNIIIALIILVLTIPDLDMPYTKNYNLSFCNKEDVDVMNEEDVDDIRVTIERFDFVACEIGYIKDEINIVLLAQTINPNIEISTWYGQIDILILNHQNYNSFVKGENYGVSNIELLSLTITPDNYIIEQNLAFVNLPSDYYFLVFDWEYGGEDEVDDVNSSVLDISYYIQFRDSDYWESLPY